MQIARVTLCNPCFKWSTTKVLEKCNLIPIAQMIQVCAHNYLHKIIFNDQPKIISDFWQFNMVRSEHARLIRRPRPIHISKSLKTELSITQRGLLLYSKLPDFLVTYNPNKFKNEITDYIKYNTPRFQIQRQTDFQ